MKVSTWLLCRRANNCRRFHDAVSHKRRAENAREYLRATPAMRMILRHDDAGRWSSLESFRGGKIFDLEEFFGGVEEEAPAS
jgi:hypothetical protein